MIHDFIVTERRIVFLMPPLNLHARHLRRGQNFLDSHVWEPEQGMRALVIDKDDPETRQWFELPSGFVFHLGGGWDDGNHVRVDYDRYPDPGNLTRFQREIMRGHGDTGHTADVMHLQLDLTTGKTHQDRIAVTSEFPALHPEYLGRRYRYRYALTCTNDMAHPFYNALRRLDLETGGDQVISFGPNRIVEEHIPVPKPDSNSEAAVWLVGMVLDLDTGRSHVTVLDGEAFESGVIFEAALPYALPLGFHGRFDPAER
jgi:carotenoid cleavage dioxygenase